MAANTNTQVVNLDFDTLKSSFITYLQGQSTFKDYNFEGSGMSVLLDVLSYNTQYNAYYLNMVANEMFLDSATQRSSVVSQAKVLNYTPKSAIAPTATVNVIVNNVGVSSLTLPAYLNFGSAAINGVNYTFVNPDSYTVNVVGNTATFNNVEIKQGVPATYNFTVDSSTNPTYTFEIPDASIDTTTIKVLVQQSSSNSSYDIFKPATNYLTLNGSSKVYFLQESLNGNYQIYFGDGILGQQLNDGNIVRVSYLSTEGTSGAGANSFVLMNTVSGYAPSAVNSVTPATQGGDKESIESIKFQAPKAFASQGRAVTKDDYITLIQQNNYGIALDSVNVWGGEENTPPQYGKIFVAIKPTGGYSLTDNQKNILINDVIKPISVLTVAPEIVNVDYVYLILNSSVLVDFKKTTLTSSQITSLVTQGIQSFCASQLNTFNSTFVIGDLINYIQNLSQAFVAVDFDLFLQRRVIPTLNSSQNYSINFGNPLQRGFSNKAISFAPSFAQYDASGNFYDPVYFEESPDTTTNIDSITVAAGGFGYTAPVITISGDGTGATATAVVENGTITAINVLIGGANYTQAVVTISDPTGQGASAVAVLRGNYSSLRTYYFNNSIKNILLGAAGTVDYTNGLVTLNNFAPSALNNTDGILRVNAYAANRIVSSSYNRIITLDNNDPAAISVTVTAK